MASYLLDVMCARNAFAGMNLSWHVAELRSTSTSTCYGKTSTRNIMPSSAMNSSTTFILLFLRRNAQEPQWEIQEKWANCERTWTKINRAMRDIGLPEFDALEDFVNLHDIVKLHAEQDSSWIVEIAKVVNMTIGQVQLFMQHPIKAQTMLQ
jgi:hypothetical protein